MEKLEKLWEIKEKENFSYKDLEREIGVDRMTIWKWRKQHSNPSPLAIEKIEKFLQKYNV